MALVQKQNTKRTLILLGVFVGVIIVGIVVYVIMNAPPGSPAGSSTPGKTGGSELPIVSDFGEAVFDDPRFRALEPYGDLPVNIGNVGRENPFTPPAR